MTPELMRLLEYVDSAVINNKVRWTPNMARFDRHVLRGRRPYLTILRREFLRYPLPSVLWDWERPNGL